jgi:Family of unknown function (DUF6049)
VHGLLPAKVRRILFALFGLFAVAQTAVLALAQPALARPVAQSGRVTVVIDAVSPQVAGPGGTVTVTGTVSNTTGRTQAGLVVQLFSSPTQFSSRDQMDQYVSQGSGVEVELAGDPVPIAASVAPGATAAWRASFGVSAVGMSQFGVYPLTVQLGDMAGGVLASTQTLLPYWPGPHGASLPQPVRIAWVWPLIDQPHQQVCGALSGIQPCTTLTDNALAASLSQDGRLAALLSAGQAHPDADLTWFIDPALLGDVAAMTRPYQVDARPDSSGVPNAPADKAAVNWLTGVKATASSQPTVIVPYANVDVAALVHQGLNAEISGAYSIGDAVAHGVLGGSYRPSIAWPAGGTADLSMLTSLAAAEGIGTVVLNSGEMPPANPAVFEPDDAVTSIRTETGTTMRVLLADQVLTGVLRNGDTSSGFLPQSTQFAVEQQFLAQTAMIAAEAPNSARSLVIAPPYNWSPSASLAGDLLTETVSAPWLTPTTLSSLAASPDAESKLVRQPPPDSRDSPGELSAAYLANIRALDGALSVYESMLYQPNPAYVRSLDEALTATESAAWRQSGAAQGLALARDLRDYVKDAEDKVKIITSIQVPMGGASGKVPVSIENGLHQAIEVRLNATVVNAKDRTSQLVIGDYQRLVTVQPGQPVLIKLPISSAPEGSTVIKLSLTSSNGTPLPFADRQLTVLSTRYGRAILFLIGAAIGILILTSIYRGMRRRLHGDAEDADGAGEAGMQSGLPGSFEAGTRSPTEAPDDLADARHWVDDA